MQFKTYPLPGGGELDVYLRTPAPAMPNALRRPLVLVVPGGGYEHVSAREADPVALQFAAAGYHAAVLTYSVGEGARNYQPLRQLSAALALLREHAEAWGVLPEQIAVCGFSAGGHLALSLLEAGFADEFLLHLAPRILGDNEAAPLFDGRSPLTMAEALDLRVCRTSLCDGDVHLQLLSHVAVLVMDEHFRADVLASDDPEQIAALLNEGLAE